MKKYAFCGMSNRSIYMFVKSLLDNYTAVGRPVAFLDKDPLRFEVCQHNVPAAQDVPTYSDEEFDKMIAETQPDAVVVAGADFTHARYALAALEKNLDVIIEKPMTTTAEDARRIMEAEKRSKGKVVVTFNYRYTATHRRIKEMILDGACGRLTFADLAWYVDTHHGASYFKRWNRTRAGSGGLSIHKCSHHFDLLNWWMGQTPVEVFAYGALNHYGPNGEKNPRKVDGRHCHDCPDRNDCAYIMRWQPNRHVEPPKDEHLDAVRGRAHGNYTNYSPDQCIFDSEIDIEDTYAVTIRYDGGAMAAYSVGFSQPYEGYRLGLSGTEGRIETQEYHGSRTPFEVEDQTITLLPLFSTGREVITPLTTAGGHGGGDPMILDDIFLGPNPRRPYEILSGAREGALAVAVGEAVWRSVKSGKPVRIADLLGEV